MNHLKHKSGKQPLRLVCSFFLLFMFLATMPLQAQSLKNSDLTVNIQNMFIRGAFDQIKQVSGYNFFYDENAISDVQKVTVQIEHGRLSDILTDLTRQTGLHFTVNKHTITVNALSNSDRPQQDPSSNPKLKYEGCVKDENGNPVVGALVGIKGTTSGTLTDIDGNFSIHLPAGAKVTISYVGHKPSELVLGSRKNLNITLESENHLMNEVVVTALGIKRSQKALSYNVQQVGGDEFLKVKDANLVNSLSGKVAGVTINSSSSGVGGASKVVMRGTKGISQSSNALYVIDGIPMYNMGGEGGQEFDSKGTTEAIADINPEDIESVSVLTGAAAAALYGSQASNGAIIITTKKGSAGHTTLTVSQNTEFSSAFRTPEFQNRYGTGDMLSDVASKDMSWGRRLNSANYMGYSPTKDYFQTGVVTTENISLSTGTSHNQTYVSASAVNSKGMVPNNKYNRYNFTFRNTTSFLKNDKMKLDVGASYIKQNDMNMTNQGRYSNPLVSAYLFPRGDDWNDIKMFERYNPERKIYTQYWPQGLDEFTGQNPYWINYRNLRENNRDRYMLNAGLSYQVLDWLNVSGRVRMDNSGDAYSEKIYASSNKTIVDGSDNGLYGITETKDRQTYADVLININKTFSHDITLQANIGASISDVRENLLKNRGPIDNDHGIANEFNVFHLDNLRTHREQSAYVEQTQSVFASIELGWKSAYYLTLTGRNDWPSQLAGPYSEQKGFFYPSVGGSVILSQIFKLPKQIPYLKLRGSFASVGLPFPRFLANPTHQWDFDNQQWIDKTNYPMYNLKPERTDSWEVGLTTRLGNHINLDFTYYNSNTYNQTFDPQISVSSAYSTLYVQTGSVRNRGVEMQLGYHNTWNNFTWSSNFTLSSNENRIMSLVDNYVHPETGQVITKDRLDVGGLNRARFVLKKGGSLGDLYSQVDLQRDSNGNIYVDQNGDVKVNNHTDDIKLGSVFPKCNMGWRNDFSWKNLSFGFLISARIGGIVYSATQAALDHYGVSEASAAARDRGGVMINGGDIINPEKWYTAIGSSDGIPEYYTYSATNVRLQEATIGYTIPKKTLKGIADITISLVARNLLMIYCKAPFDPEAVATTGNYYQGIDNFMLPSLRNMGFNVRFRF